MEALPFYHQGMLELQQAAGSRRLSDHLATQVRHSSFSEKDIAQIEAANFFFIASSHRDQPDCSFKGGDPGFVRVVGANLLEFPDYDGNLMYRTLGNIAMNPRVGLLFMNFDPASYRIRINGSASVHRGADSLAQHHGARAVVRIACHDIYPNCPRYVPGLTAGEPSAYVPRPGKVPPRPEWQSLPEIAPLLPDELDHGR